MKESEHVATSIDDDLILKAFVTRKNESSYIGRLETPLPPPEISYLHGSVLYPARQLDTRTSGINAHSDFGLSHSIKCVCALIGYYGLTKIAKNCNIKNIVE